MLMLDLCYQTLFMEHWQVNIRRELSSNMEYIEAMESKGRVDPDAYRKLAEIDSGVQKVKPSLR